MWLVTGATGHVGNVLVRRLLERGEKVRALILPGESRESLSGLAVDAPVEDRSLSRVPVSAEALARVDAWLAAEGWGSGCVWAAVAATAWWAWRVPRWRAAARVAFMSFSRRSQSGLAPLMCAGVGLRE